MSGHGFDRRSFLLGALGAGAAAAFAGLKPWRALIEFKTRTLPARLVALLDHRQSAAAVGREYLEAAGGPPAEEGEFAGAIATRLEGGRTAAEDASQDELRTLLAAAIRRDFEGEHVVRLRGWVVSETEARLCALAALDGRQRRRA